MNCLGQFRVMRTVIKMSKKRGGVKPPSNGNGKTMTIKMKTLAVLSLVLSIFALTIGTTIWSLKTQQTAIEANERGAGQVADLAVPLLVTVKEIKADVIQVQQWLADISATRGLDGLDDGFQQAEVFAGKFAQDIAGAKEIAGTLGYAGIEKALDELLATFPAYYEVGVRMAKAYVAEGPSAGNKLMGDVDQAAEQMGEVLDGLLAQAEQKTRTTLTELKEVSHGVQEQNSGLIMLLIGCAVVSGLIGLGGSGFLFLTLARSFNALSTDVETVGSDDAEKPLMLKPERRDEFGPVAVALHHFRESRAEMERLRVQNEEAERRAEEERRAMMMKMADDFETSVGQVVDQVSSASTEMEASSQSMTVTAEQTTNQSAAVAAASEQASANVQMVASAAEELSSSISEISRQVSQSSQIASAAVKQAEQTNVKVRGLAEAANRIGEVVALITDIAEQTNLLALNATIEAARAGDAGKGFAVVASEVKNLANQTAKATDEIGTQIGDIQTATKEAVSAIEEITKTIAEIDEVASGIASAVEEQGAATQEIARNVEQAAAGTEEVSNNISGVSQAANDTGAAATEIRSAAGELSQQSETLRSEVGKFLDTVRAA